MQCRRCRRAGLGVVRMGVVVMGMGLGRVWVVTPTIVIVLSSIALVGVILGNGKEMRCE